ncbi:MAG TPA: DUF4440 domain-containing protein, partial [Steroidobacteraceae bacterium]
MEIEAYAIAEVKALHAFFGQWYASPGELHLDRVAGASAPEFELLAPSGELLSRDELIEDLRAERGAYPNLRICIEDLKVYSASSIEVCLRYIEVHRDGASMERRQCCGLLRARATVDRLSWVAVVERY